MLHANLLRSLCGGYFWLSMSNWMLTNCIIISFYCLFGCICFKKTRYLYHSLTDLNQILTQGGDVKWLDPYQKLTSSTARLGHNLGKTLSGMNIKQLLQPECIALQHISIKTLFSQESIDVIHCAQPPPHSTQIDIHSDNSTSRNR